MRTNHYSRIAVVFIRLAAFVLLLMGIMGGVQSMLDWLLRLPSSDGLTAGGRAGVSLLYLVTGTVIFFLSKPLGIFIGRDLETQSEQKIEK